jgi:NMT1/THI5 like protein
MIRLSTLALLALAAIVSTAHAQHKLTVAVGGRGIGESCLTEIGKNAGLFARHGIDLNLVYTDGGGETQQAVVSNSAQIGVTSGMLGAMSLYAKGAPVRVIGASYSGGSQIYWYVPAGSAVKTPQDLDGRNVSYSSFSRVRRLCEVLRAVRRAGEARAERVPAPRGARSGPHHRHRRGDGGCGRLQVHRRAAEQGAGGGADPGSGVEAIASCVIASEAKQSRFACA